MPGSRRPIEDTIRGRLAGWMNEILGQEDLCLEYVDEQWPIRNGTTVFADLVFWEKKQDVPACVTEYKPPAGWSPYDYDLIDDALFKATKIRPQARFFGTWNTNQIVIWETYDPQAQHLIERRRGQFQIAKIPTLTELNRPEVEAQVKGSLRSFLRQFCQIYEGVQVLQRYPTDEFFVQVVRSAIDALYYPISVEIQRTYKGDASFRTKLNRWFAEQSWLPPSTEEDFYKAARQYAYLLTDKVLFYNALRLHYPDELGEIQLPPATKTSSAFKDKLQEYFDQAQEVTHDYEPVFKTNFIERFPIPGSLIPRLVAFVNNFNRYDVSRLTYADIGRIYDRLIPDNERHKLGQYFTRDDVVDLINVSCLRSPEDVTADFGCGVGTFLVRAYALKKSLGPDKSHTSILNELIGVDISKFPAHLATINLMIRDFSEERNYPQIKNEDFFNTSPEGARPKRAVVLPSVDCVVGNPPYTRQEEIEDITFQGYKERIQKVIKDDWPKAKIGKKAGIHFYFFLHGFKFLKDHGRFGYVVSNSWMDADIGGSLQEFFLEHSKIVAVIEPKAERWFEDADINTCIVVLEKTENEDERKRNVVHFAQLKKNLPALFARVDDEPRRWETIRALIEAIDRADEFVETDDFRVYPIRQEDLWNEGYDEEREKYVGAKWGKYVRAPDVFFTRILSHRGNLLVPLGSLAQVNEGEPTGANDFFFLSDKQLKVWGIEQRYLRRAVRSPKPVSGFKLRPEDVRHSKLVVHEPFSKLSGKHVAKYIKWGEREGYKKDYFPDLWYSRDATVVPLLCPRAVWNRYVCFLNETDIVASDRFIEITPKPEVKRFTKVLGAFLNSTVGALLNELYGRTVLGLGVLDFQPTDLRKMPVIDPRKLDAKTEKRLVDAYNALCQREGAFEIQAELGADKPEDVSIDKVLEDRRALDEVVFEILGFNDDERLQLYSALLDLFAARARRAQSVEKRRTKGPDIKTLAAGVVREIPAELMKSFPDDFIGNGGARYHVMELPQGKPILKSELDGIYLEIDTHRIPCESKWIAQYLFFSALHGKTRAKVPVDQSRVRELVGVYTPIFRKLETHVANHLKEYFPDKRVRRAAEAEIWRSIFRRFES